MAERATPPIVNKVDLTWLDIPPCHKRVISSCSIPGNYNALGGSLTPDQKTSIFCQLHPVSLVTNSRIRTNLATYANITGCTLD